MSEGVLGKVGGSDLSKMMLFMFLGLVIAILVLGFHKSPPATAGATRQTGAPSSGASQPSNPAVSVTETYIEEEY